MKIWTSCDYYENAKQFFPEHEVILDETLISAWRIGDVQPMDKDIPVTVRISVNDKG